MHHQQGAQWGMLANAQGVWGALEPVLWLAGVLFIGAFVFMTIQRWRKNRTAEDCGEEELAEYRQLYEEGVISEQEFKRLHALLSGRLKENVLPETPPPPSDKTGDK